MKANIAEDASFYAVRYDENLINRIKFTEVDEATKKALQDFLPVIKQALPDILTEFYSYLEQWPELIVMFKDQSRKNHAKEQQEKHWLRLFQATFNTDYLESVRRIGRIHSHIGLEPTWYINAYAFTLNRLYAAASAHYQSRLSPSKAAQKTAELMRALNQCVMIDMDIAISVYLEENKRKHEEHLNTLANEFETSIGTIIDSVSSASTELEASAQSLSSMATQTSASSSSVTSAAQETSSNVAAVSSATEEMSATLGTVASMAQKSSQVTDKAAQETDRSVTTMQDLKTAIDKVSEVAELISSIAEQTNLLALNATIEAARAGEAGKGFAVVAHEVKALANETAKATENIQAQIEEIIQKSNDVTDVLSVVSQAISESKQVANDTAQSVDEQKLAIKEIARNVELTAEGNREIVQNIQDIDSGTQSVSQSARGIYDAAHELAEQSTSLQDTMKKFITEIKSETI